VCNQLAGHDGDAEIDEQREHMVAARNCERVEGRDQEEVKREKRQHRRQHGRAGPCRQRQDECRQEKDEPDIEQPEVGAQNDHRASGHDNDEHGDQVAQVCERELGIQAVHDGVKRSESWIPPTCVPKHRSSG